MTADILNAALDRMTIIEGDITSLDVDAIVNAANDRLLPGGGVCGAIHAAAGTGLAAECARVGPCEIGDAKLTGGHMLTARFVIHAVGPVWHGGNMGEIGHLAACYHRALELALDAGLKSIAFPAISTGIFGFPTDQAASIAVRTVADFLTHQDPHSPLLQVMFCCFGPDCVRLHADALSKLRDS